MRSIETFYLGNLSQQETVLVLFWMFCIVCVKWTCSKRFYLHERITIGLRKIVIKYKKDAFLAFSRINWWDSLLHSSGFREISIIEMALMLMATFSLIRFKAAAFFFNFSLFVYTSSFITKQFVFFLMI